MYGMIVLDLDGTLTNSKKVITPETRHALIRAQRAGKKVVLASGRPTAGIVRLAEELSLEEYGGFILSFNGGRIIDFQTGRVIYNKTVPKELTAPLYKEALALGLGILTYSDSEIILGTQVDEYNRRESEINLIPMRQVSDFPATVDFLVNKFLMTGEPDKILYAQGHMRNLFGWELNIFRSEPYFLELMPQSIDKAYSLGILLEHIGLDRTSMICCGDGFNDRSMIHFAGLGVAMANAQEEVKEVADFITDSNDENGIVKVINRFLLEEE